MQESFNRYQHSPSQTFREKYTPMSRLDELLLKNQQIYQNLKLKLSDIAQSNKKIDRNLFNMKPLYEYAESNRSSKQKRIFFKDENNFREQRESHGSAQQSSDFTKRKIQMAQQIERQQRTRNGQHQLELVRQLSNQQGYANNYFEQRVINDRISLQSSRPIEKLQHTESSRLSSIQVFTPQYYKQQESSQFVQVPKRKTNRVYIQNSQKNFKMDQSNMPKYSESHINHRKHVNNHLQESSAIADQDMGISNQAVKNVLSKSRQQEITFNQRQKNSNSLQNNEDSELIDKNRLPPKSHIMIKQSEEEMSGVYSNSRIRRDRLEIQFQNPSNAPVRHSSPGSRSLNKNKVSSLNKSKLSNAEERRITNIIIHSNKKFKSIQESFRSGEAKINEQRITRKSQISPCKSNSKIKYGEKSLFSKLQYDSKIRKQQTRITPKTKSFMYIPFNKLYTSTVLQMKNPTTLLLARQSKSSMNQRSPIGRIIDGSTFKYKKGVIITDQNQLIERLMNQNTVQLFNLSSYESQALDKIKQGKHISIAFVGGKDTHKKKLHVGIVYQAIGELEQLIRNYIQLSFKNNYTSNIVITIEHSEILSLIEEPQSFQQEFVFNVPLNQKDRQFCYYTLERFKKVLENICQTVKKNDEDILSSYKHITLGQKQKKKCKRLRITKISAILVTGINLGQSKLGQKQKQMQFVSEHNESNYSSPTRITKNKRLYSLQLISTNRYDLNFVKCFEAQKLVWCINPLLKNYHITRETLNISNLFMKPSQKQNRSISNRKNKKID